jgi:hypothetical protein
MSEAKTKKVGQLRQFIDKQTGQPGKFKLEIDGASLGEVIDLLCDFEAKYKLKELSKEDIWAAQKLKFGDPNRIPKLTIVGFDPNELAPDSVLADMLIFKDECK